MDWIITPARASAAAALLASYALLCGGIAWQRARLRQAGRREQQDLQTGGPAVLVAYASQTGQAEALAHATAHVLHTGGCAVRLLPVQSVTLAELQAHPRSLWLLSTTGEGDAPDHALPFVRGLLSRAAPLAGHQGRVLALGDSAYAQFCAFGLRVQHWLQAQGAKADAVCMDNGDAAALHDWQTGVAELLHALTGQAAAGWRAPDAPRPWTLRRRTHLNPGSQGGPVYLLEWVPESGPLPAWESGDLAALTVPADPGRPRDYSIASIPQDGSLHLLVRQSQRADGTPGAASGWLCQGMAVGGSLPLSLRAHSGFRLGDNAARPLVLIGNGTGLAGLASHIRARAAQGRGDQWLLFGERSPDHDALLDPQLRQWLAQGQLARLDRAWSRPGTGQAGQPGYVQHLLAREAAALRDWVARGAALYVCGSQQGMAQGVDTALRQALGNAQVDALAAEGRYRRDVY
ncbi:MAG: sulfite reductase subunit alpha [Acidovorax sp.]